MLSVRFCVCQFSLTFDEMITQVLWSFPSLLQPKAHGVDVTKHTQDEYRGRWTARRNECASQQSLVSSQHLMCVCTNVVTVDVLL